MFAQACSIFFGSPLAEIKPMPAMTTLNREKRPAIKNIRRRIFVPKMINPPSFSPYDEL